MRLLVTRPKEDAERLEDSLRALGAEPVVEPMLSIDFKDGPPLELEGVQAILATSANGPRAFARRDDRRHLPLFAVGDASARAAAEAGFTRIESAAGDVHDLARLVRERLRAEAGALMHVSGTEIAGDLAALLDEAGFAYRREVLYGARPPSQLSVALVRALEDGRLTGALFFSPRTAATFVTLVMRCGLAEACTGMVAYCLSPAVAERARSIAWRAVVVARRPDQEALLESVQEGVGRPGSDGGQRTADRLQ